MKVNYEDYKLNEQYRIINFKGKNLYYGIALYSFRLKLNVTNAKLLDKLCDFKDGTVYNLEKDKLRNRMSVEHNIENLIKLNNILKDIKKGRYKVITEYNVKNHRYVTIDIVKA